VERCARELPKATCVVLPKFSHFSLYLHGAQVLPVILDDLRTFLATAHAPTQPAAI
jgi:hypothetical protein